MDGISRRSGNRRSALHHLGAAYGPFVPGGGDLGLGQAQRGELIFDHGPQAYFRTADLLAGADLFREAAFAALSASLTPFLRGTELPWGLQF